jgi:hypothetical protein
MIDAYFADAAADRLHVAEIAESQPIKPDTDPCGRPAVAQRSNHDVPYRAQCQQPSKHFRPPVAVGSFG